MSLHFPGKNCLMTNKMISENLKRLQDKIQTTCREIGRNPEEIVLVAVTKKVFLEQIKEVVSSGIKNIGENRVQEALKKHSELAFNVQRSTFNDVKWHLVGHLQKNKVKYALRIFDLIHSVDDLELAEEIDKQARKIGKVQDCLIEVKISPEVAKYGCPPEKVEDLVEQTNELTNIRICGLMAMAPFFENSEETRPYFRQAFECYSLLATRYSFTYLSMGMSNDFVIALKEGANMLRIGTAIFRGVEI